MEDQKEPQPKVSKFS